MIVGENSVVGVCLVVIDDVVDNIVVVGNFVKLIKDFGKEEVFVWCEMMFENEEVEKVKEDYFY